MTPTVRRLWLAVVALSLTWVGAGAAEGRPVDGVAGPDQARGPLLWRRVASEEFDGPLALDRWTPYTGRPGCCEDTLWSPVQVRVRQGALVLRNNPDRSGTWISGGVGGWNWTAGTRLFGRWDARVQMEVGGGISASALLWPTTGWPPELNYFEVFDTWPRRDRMAVTTHFMEDQSPNLSQWIVHDDFTDWHVVSVRWTPTELVYVVDGIRVLVETDPDRIPRTAMWPAFQTHVHRLSNGHFPQLIPGQASVRMRVDWVRVYEQAGTAS